MRIIAGGSSYPAAPQPRPLPAPAVDAAEASAPPTATVLPATSVRSSLQQQLLPPGLSPRHRQALQAYLVVQRLPNHGVDVLGLDAHA